MADLTNMEMTTTTTTNHTDSPSPARRPEGLFRSPPVVVRRSPAVVIHESGGKRLRERFAEQAGERTAECAAVCCCFPVGLVDLLVVVAVKLPAGLVRRAVRRHRIKQRRNKSPLLLGKGRPSDANSEDEFGVHRLSSVDELWAEMAPTQDVLELEQAMWESFYNAGFWRSLSEKEEVEVRFVPITSVEEENK